MSSYVLGFGAKELECNKPTLFYDSRCRMRIKLTQGLAKITIQ